MSGGISKNPLNDISQVYLDTVAKVKDAEVKQDIERWGQTQKESQDPTANKHQTQEDYKKLPVAKMAKKISDKSFKSGQSGVSTKSAEQTGKMIGVLDTHDPQRSKAKSKMRGEGFSSWRGEMREVIDQDVAAFLDRPQTEKKAEKEVKEKNVKNKVVINPTLSDAVELLGGKLIEVKVSEEKKVVKKEVTALQKAAKTLRGKFVAKADKIEENVGSTVVDHGNAPDKGTHGGVIDSKQKRVDQQKAFLLKRKAQLAARGVQGINASYDPMQVEEEVGVSSSAKMKEAQKEAELKKKEEEAVKKAKKVNEAKVDTGSAAEKASARNLRNTPPGGNRKFDTSVFITRKPGESLDSARTRKRREAHAGKRGVKEDKAFDNVVGALRKKHGESGVLTKDSPKPKAKPLNAKQIWKRDNRDAIQREVDAQYGRTPWNKKGSLGT